MNLVSPLALAGAAPNSQETRDVQEDQRIRILEREIFRLHQLQMEMPNQAPPFSEQEISQAARDQHWEQLVDQNSRLGAYQLHLQEQIGKLEGTLVDTRLRLSLDPLTGLLDSGELARLLQECGDPTHVARESVALILLEIDQGFFERCLGAQRCYWLIRQAAQRLAAIVEVGDSLGRWADAQFLIIIRAPIAEKAQLHERVGLLARRLTQSLDRPVDFGGIPLTVSASAGALVVDGEDAAVALERVRRALSHAKTTGTSFHVYGDELRDRARRLAALQPALAQARSQGQLKVFYQPIIAAKDGLTAMLETRLRWIRPQGVIEARQFVEVLEESGEILSLDEWVLEEACRQVSGLSRVSVSVNLSPGHLLVADLPRRIFQLVERSGLAPERVCIELSEMGLVQAPAQVGTLARELSRMGISVAIDGFGSRLSSLAGLPVRFLKLDAQLVSQLDQPECQRLCKAALSLAHQMGIEVIAKRVETPRQVAWLRQAGCDYLQGYLFSVPVPLQEVAPLVDRPWGNAVALEGAGGQA